MSPDVWRCPDCGCLALPFSHTHRRTCAYGVTPAEELAYAMASSPAAAPDPPEYRIPQEEDDQT